MLPLVVFVLGVAAGVLGRQDDVNENVNAVNIGLRDDLRSLDRTVTRDLKRLEDQNRRDLAELEKRTADALAQLEGWITAADERTLATAREELHSLEASLRDDSRLVDDVMRKRTRLSPNRWLASRSGSPRSRRSSASTRPCRLGVLSSVGPLPSDGGLPC
jgi:hypothetical protein